MRRTIKTCKQYYCYGCSINTTDFPVVNVYLTDYPVVKVYFDELSTARIEQHKLCATLSANGNINYRLLPIKVYYCICTVRHQNRNNSWKPECVLSFNGLVDISKFYPSPLARDK